MCSAWTTRAFLLAGALAGLVRPALAQTPPSRPQFEWPKLFRLASPAIRLTLLSKPDLRIGSADGPDHTLFNGIAGAARLSQGDIALGDAGNRRVLFFDARGGFRRSVGRVGDGPGEFRQPRWFGRCSDGSLAFHDGAHARLTYFSPDGAIRGFESLPVGANFDQILWCSGAKLLFIFLNRPRGPVQPGEYLQIPTVLVRAEGPAIDTILKSGIREFYIGKTVSALSAVPLGQATEAIAGRGIMYVCSNWEGSCDVIDTTGRRLRVFELHLPRRRVGPAEWTKAIADHFQAEPARGVRISGAKLMKEIRPKEEFPAFDQIRSDVEGNLWVRTFDNYLTTVATWVAFTPLGTPFAMIAVPRAFQILEIGRDYIVGFERDQEDVEFLEVRLFPQLRRPLSF
jgi:hypothetical protein